MIGHSVKDLRGFYAIGSQALLSHPMHVHVLLLAVLFITISGAAGEILLVGKRTQNRRSWSWDGVLSPEDFEEGKPYHTR